MNNKRLGLLGWSWIVLSVLLMNAVPLLAAQEGSKGMCPACGSSIKQLGCLVSDGEAQGNVDPILAEILGGTFFLGYKTSSDGATCEPPDTDPTLITLISFTAASGEGRVLLNWETGSEVDTVGYNILRADSPNGPFQRVNAVVIAAMGSITSGATYAFVDTKVSNGTPYHYRLEDIDFHGMITAHNTVSAMPMFASAPPPSEGTAAAVSNPPSLNPDPVGSEPVGSVEETPPMEGTSVSSPAPPSGSRRSSARTGSQTFLYQIITSDGSELTVSRGQSEDKAEVEAKVEGKGKMSFKAEGEEGRIIVAWVARNEDDGYYLWRSDKDGETYIQITDFLLPAFDMEHSEEPLKFEYADASVLPDVPYHYKLEAMDVLGKSRFVAKASATPVAMRKDDEDKVEAEAKVEGSAK